MFCFNTPKFVNFLLMTLASIAISFMTIIPCTNVIASNLYRIVEENEELQTELAEIYNNLPLATKESQKSPEETMKIFIENMLSMLSDKRNFEFFIAGHASFLGYVENSANKENIAIIASTFLEVCLEGCSCPPLISRGFSLHKVNKVSHIYQQAFVKHAISIFHKLPEYVTQEHPLGIELKYFFEMSETEITNGKIKSEHFKVAQNINNLLRGLRSHNLLHIPCLNTILETEGLSKNKLNKCIRISPNDGTNRLLHVNFNELEILISYIISSYSTAKVDADTTIRGHSRISANIFTIQNTETQTTSFDEYIYEHIKIVTSFLNRINNHADNIYSMTEEIFVAIWHAASTAYGDNRRNQQLGLDLCGMILFAACKSTCQDTFIDQLIHYNNICIKMDKGLRNLDDAESLENRFHCCIKNANNTTLSYQADFLSETSKDTLINGAVVEESESTSETGEDGFFSMDEYEEVKDISIDETEGEKGISTDETEGEKGISTDELKEEKRISTDELKEDKGMSTDELKEDKGISTDELKEDKGISIDELKEDKGMSTDDPEEVKNISIDETEGEKGISTDELKEDKGMSINELINNLKKLDVEHDSETHANNTVLITATMAPATHLRSKDNHAQEPSSTVCELEKYSDATDFIVKVEDEDEVVKPVLNKKMKTKLPIRSSQKPKRKPKDKKRKKRIDDNLQRQRKKAPNS